MREIILGIMCVLFIIGYFKSCYSVDEEKKSGILWIFLMTFLFAFSMLLNYIYIEKQDRLEKQLIEKSKGLPKYEEIHGVYIIKK
jgi:RsiW-degrading membrane proteinase PrsW (M82 family)